MELNQGDTSHIQITFVNRTALPGDHPLRVNGFQTPGMTFMAQLESNTEPPVEVNIPAGDIVAVSPDQANMTIRPEATQSLTLSRPTRFRVIVRLMGPGNQPAYTLTTFDTTITLNPQRI